MKSLLFEDMAIYSTVFYTAALILFNWNSVEAIAETYINCLDSPQEWKPTKLTCKINGTATSGIKYYRPNGGKREEVLICNTANTDCLTVGFRPGYNFVRDSSSQVTLTVESFNRTVDEGEWICSDGAAPGVGNTTCPKIISSPGESLDWCIAVSAVLAVLIVVGIVILILVLKEPFDDKILKTLGIVLVVVGACVIVTAVVTAILLAIKTNVDRTEGSWIAAVAFCALGFLFGAVFCALGVIKMSKLSKKDSKPVSGNSRELRNETGTPLNK